ncbi:MAG: hypothetical protein V4559_00755 [Pseudomonadota bacterium]
MRKKALLATLAAVIGLATASAAAPSGDHWIVPGVRIGAAVLEQADQGALVRDLGEPDQTVQRGDRAWYRFGPQTDGAPPDELVVEFDLAKDAPLEISTASPLYRMRNGLGVGSAAATVRAVQGAPLCEGGNADGEGVIVYDTIWFRISQGNVSRVSIRKQLSAADFQVGPIHC